MSTDYSDYHGLRRVIGRPIAAVKTENDGVYDGGYLVFHFIDGTEQRFRADGDCCSHSWIEYLIVPDGVVGQVVTEVLESEGVDATPEQEAHCRANHGNEGYLDVLLVYQTFFVTPVGEIVVEYRNDSNGYYGGSLEAIG